MRLTDLWAVKRIAFRQALLTVETKRNLEIDYSVVVAIGQNVKYAERLMQN